MKPEAQRIAIAEACGARIITKRMEDAADGKRRYGKKWAWGGDEATPCSHPGGGFFGWGWNEEPSISELPDYLNDLNACHEMEKRLSASQQQRYAEELYALLLGHAERHWSDDKFWLVHATAAQRAEAFLRTIGKWEES